MLDNQLTLDVSPYSTLYDIVVPKTHFLHQLTDLCDFSFIYDELEKIIILTLDVVPTLLS